MPDVRHARGHVRPHKEWETNGTNKRISKTEIRVTDVKNKLMITSGEKDKLEVWDWHIHTTINKWIINKDLLYSTENYSVLCNDLYEKKNWEKIVDMHVKKEHVYNWFTLLYSRNQHNIVNELYPSKNLKKKEWEPAELDLREKHWPLFGCLCLLARPRLWMDLTMTCLCMMDQDPGLLSSYSWNQFSCGHLWVFSTTCCCMSAENYVLVVNYNKNNNGS